MRRRNRILSGVALCLALLSVQCAGPRRLPPLEKPAVVEVDGADPLLVKVTGMEKRRLRSDELSPPTTAGFLWEYRVIVSNPTATAVTLDRLRLTLQNLWGGSWPGDQPLNLTVPQGSEGEVVVQARLASTDPKDAAALTGVQTVTFLGRRADGTLVSFTVRIPLH